LLRPARNGRSRVGPPMGPMQDQEGCSRLPVSLCLSMLAFEHEIERLGTHWVMNAAINLIGESVRAAVAVQAERKARAVCRGGSRCAPIREPSKAIGSIARSAPFVSAGVQLGSPCSRRPSSPVASTRSTTARKDTWRLRPDPTEAAYNRARIAAAKEGSGREWIGEASQTPLTRGGSQLRSCGQSQPRQNAVGSRA